MGRDCIEALICSYAWPCDEAIRVVYGPTPPSAKAPGGCPNGESSGQADVISGTGDVGLFGINVVWQGSRVLPGPRRKLTDPTEIAEATALLKLPALNIEAAYELYVESGGWEDWSCQP